MTMQHYLKNLETVTKQFWNKKALVSFGGESFTYGEMAVFMKKFHVLFELLGLKKGDKIALCAKNSARWGLAYLASNTYETVTVPILDDFTPQGVMSLVEHSESKILFVGKDKWMKMDATKMPGLLMAIDADTWHLLYSADDFVKEAFTKFEDEYVTRYPQGFGPDQLKYPCDNMEDLSTINYTSGSTGTPKGVMLSYKNFSYVVDFCQRYLSADSSCSIVSMLPMAHMYGLVVEFIYPLCHGVTVYWLGKAPTPSTLMKAFAEVKPYLLVTVPLVMEKIHKNKIMPVIEKPYMKFMLNVPVIKDLLLAVIRKKLLQSFGGNIREIILGGAAVNPEVEKWLKKIKMPYVVGYGMTEATPLIAYEGHRKFVMGSCGKSIDCSVVRIDSPDPHNIVGEIQTKGPNVCMGYYKNIEATEAAFTEDGFLKTGDLGIIDKEGNIFIRGRSKNMILGASGQNIYPEELEAVINNQRFVSESVVVDRDGHLVALVYLDEEEVKSAKSSGEIISDIQEQIKISSNESLPNYSKISKVEIMDKPFEKTPKLSIKRFLYV